MGWGSAIAVAMLLAWFALTPQGSERLTWGDDVIAADSRAETNNSNAEGAPQQTVVNGWHSADLAAIQIDQLEAQHNAILDSVQAETRTGMMVLLLGIGVAGELVLRGISGRTEDQAPRAA